MFFRFTGGVKKAINMGSYNYLGFGECEGPCTDSALDSIRKYGVSSSTSRLEGMFFSDLKVYVFIIQKQSFP